MSDRCCSTLICARRDKEVFEKIGYSVQQWPPLTVDGNEIPHGVVVFAEEAANGNYDPLTNLKGVPFIVCNGSYPGAFGDHLIVSDGREWHYSEALHESSYPAVRVEPCGIVQSAEVNDARKYWAVYSNTIAAIRSSRT
jgi:hypothetical protein